MPDLESYFKHFRENTIGYNQTFETPFGKKTMVYADWIASGRLYKPIEEKICELFGPFVGNTHTETSVTGTTMTKAYHHAQTIIKKHVNASKDDFIITTGSGMTGVINKFLRILGMRVPEQVRQYLSMPEEVKPVVFLTHMEHHSNQTCWLESLADIVVLEPNEEGLVDLSVLERELEKHKDRVLKIGSFTACSNVTGIRTPIYKMAKLMHEYNGLCFADFACSAPYVPINMHPEDNAEHLDAIFFSPHKFLGGPGSPGVLIFNGSLYHNAVPDHPGGGTVDWTNPWGEHKFINNIEAREDGGTPAFLQTIRAALAIQLKEQMKSVNMLEREDQLVKFFFEEFGKIPNLHILAENVKDRLGAISFYVDNVHYNLIVKLLNDRYGIQVRGGCSCAGTYGHFLLHVSKEASHRITEQINKGDLSDKPGWVRLSLHPTMTDDEAAFIAEAMKEIVQHHDEWSKDYYYDSSKNEYHHKTFDERNESRMEQWFDMKVDIADAAYEQE